jgi:hypothetical protein
MVGLPHWLRDFANSVALRMTPMDLMSPLGCHIYRAEGVWEVTLFASSTEIVGGNHDGVRRPSKFSVDLHGVCELFTEVTAFNWQALSLGPDDELGAHISIEGNYNGHDIWLRVLSKAPRRFEPGRQSMVYQLSLEETW